LTICDEEDRQVETSAFFLPTGPDSFTATEAAQGPWDPNAMHGGPPAALVATLLARQAAELSPTLRLARLSLDFLGGLPLGELAAAVTVPRPGKRVALLEATLSAGGRVVLVGRGWFINAAEAGGDSPAQLAGAPTFGEVPALAPPPPLPETEQPQRFFSAEHSFGYGHANEWRFTSGGFDQLGPGAAWSRARVPLIAGEPLTGLQRLLILADAANGVSGAMDYNHWVFIPPGLTVTMLREPVGEWIHLAARTTLGDDGIALCHGHLSDAGGPVALVSQPVLVSRR
jgi:hypothetical protein